MDLPETIKEITENSAEIEAYHIEAMAAAYLKLTHLSPDKVRLVRKAEGSKMVWYFEERETSRLEALEEVAKAAREFWLAIDNHEWFDEAKKQALYDALYKLEQLEEKQS